MSFCRGGDADEKPLYLVENSYGGVHRFAQDDSAGGFLRSLGSLRCSGFRCSFPFCPDPRAGTSLHRCYQPKNSQPKT
jgi:hypothetical protein